MFARGIIAFLCVLVVISDGARVPKCRYPPNACPMNYSPVCGTNGVTYANECMLCAAMKGTKIKLLVRKEGPC